MPENTLLVEGDTSLRVQIGVYARPGGDAAVQRDTPRKPWFELRHRAREGIAQSGNQLKQRELAITDPAADEMAVALRVLFEHPLEIAKVFRNSIGNKIGGSSA